MDLIFVDKEKNETIKIDLPEVQTHEKIINNIISIKSEAFRDVSVAILEKFINAALNIEKDIQSSGYYPGQKEKLAECPLSVTGIRLT